MILFYHGLVEKQQKNDFSCIFSASH